MINIVNQRKFYMTANALVTTRIDPEVKAEASAVLAALGLTISDAMRLLLTRVAQEGALPFEPVVPKTETIKKVKLARIAKAAQHPEATKFPSIPETTSQRYLSGMAALNLPSPSGSGDWHLIETFFKPRLRQPRLFIAGTGYEANTNPLLGDRGVFECSAQLNLLKIPHPEGPAFAASHARAIADLVLVSVLDGGSPDFVQLDDWMPTESDKRDVFELLDVALPQLNPEQQATVHKWRAMNSH